MLIVLAGGIGSGKTTVSKLLEARGYTVLYADDINRELLAQESYLVLLRDAFPQAFLDGKLNKRTLRNIVFNDENARLKLNALAHPKILAEIKYRAARVPVAFAEIPLVGCAKLDKGFYDKLCVVTAPKEVRVRRVMARDDISYAEAVATIDAQKTEDDICKLADFVIHNDGDYESLESQIDCMLRYAR